MLINIRYVLLNFVPSFALYLQYFQHQILIILIPSPPPSPKKNKFKINNYIKCFRYKQNKSLFDRIFQNLIAITRIICLFDSLLIYFLNSLQNIISWSYFIKSLQCFILMTNYEMLFFLNFISYLICYTILYIYIYMNLNLARRVKAFKLFHLSIQNNNFLLEDDFPLQFADK